MNTFYEYVENELDKEGRSKKWLAEKIEINYNTFVSYKKRNDMPINVIVKIAKLLDINLEVLKDIY